MRYSNVAYDIYIKEQCLRLIARHCGNAHPHICSYLIRRHGFWDLCRRERDPGSKSKAAHLKDILGDMLYLLKNMKMIRKATEIVAIGPMALNLALFSKLGLISTRKRIYWFGLFIHNPRWLQFSRLIFKVLDSKRIYYVLFSNFEKDLYEKALSLPEDRILYLPYGDINENQTSKCPQIEIPRWRDCKEFYFSGGYSNRDYRSLINIFKSMSSNLVIICSSLNKEIDERDLPENIKILRDQPSEIFDAYVRTAKACIIPIAHNTGAAGQSCLLRYMKYGKIIIASDTGIIREYISDGVSGILVKNNQEAMANAIRAVNANQRLFEKLADATQERFLNTFSGTAIRFRLDYLFSPECHKVAIAEH